MAPRARRISITQIGGGLCAVACGVGLAASEIGTHGWVGAASGPLALALLGAAPLALWTRARINSLSARLRRVEQTNAELEHQLDTLTDQRAAGGRRPVLLQPRRTAQIYQVQMEAQAARYAELAERYHQLREDHDDLCSEYNVLVLQELQARNALFGQRGPRHDTAEGGAVIRPPRWRRPAVDAGGAAREQHQPVN